MGYRDAIMGNAALLAGKVVLDVGCGTGILSMMAARAGAKRVIAVDASDIADQARRIVAANRLSDVVTVVRGTMEAITLPEGLTQVDVIVSEWMGYALLYESMLPSVLYARDRYLAPGGIVLPTSCVVYVSLSSHDRLTFWDDVYGFDMGVLQEQAMREATVEVVPPEAALSACAHVRAVDVTSTSDDALDFSAPFTLSATREGTLRGFVIHFDALFDLASKGGVCTAFSTSPLEPPTHWKQTSLYLKEPLSIQAGEKIAGTLTFSRGLEYKRAYDMTISFTPPRASAPVTQLWRML